MTYYVYYWSMFGKALWGTYFTANDAFQAATECRRSYRYVKIEEASHA